MPVEPCFLSQVTNEQFKNDITPEERGMFWRYAKSIGADKGVDHPTVIKQMAKDFNMPERLVAQALDGPKSLRRASDELRARQKNTARFLSANAKHLENLDKTGAEKVWNIAYDGSRSSLLYAHGPVPPVTHALDVAMTNPVEFAQAYLRGMKALSPEATTKIMEKLEGQKYFKAFQDAGLPIGKGDIGMEGFPKTGWASRSMDAALKPLRYNLMEAKWESLPKEEQTPEMMKNLAIQYAHATGSMVKGEKLEVYTRGFRKLALAPQLTVSKWAKTVTDPIQTLKTLERTVESKFNPNIRPPTVEERRIAYNRIRRGATYFGTTLGALVANEALLKATGSRQKVNLDDPKRGDWLAFKFAGHSFRMRGTIEVVALLSKMGALASQKWKYGQQTPEETAAKYAEYKLTPGIGLGKELITGKDIFGRPVPWSSDPGNRKFPRKNYMEFVGEHGPIFVGHFISAFHETLRDQGVDTRNSRTVLNAIMRNPQAVHKALLEAGMSGGAEFFGINIQPDRYIGK